MQEKIEELLIDWEIARQESRPVTPEELCAECPELLEQLRQEINKLNQTSWLFNEDDELQGVHQPTSSTVTKADFWKAIADHRLLTNEQIESCKSEFKASPGSTEIANHLVDRDQLTQYQADVLLGIKRGPISLDRYVVLDEIEQGGMGEVYKALHTSMKRTVAIKVLSSHSQLSKQRRERFIREIESIAKLNHANIVTAYDANEVEGRLFLAMEFVNGPNLSQHVIERGPLDTATALDLTRQIAQATQFAHSHGIIHRDIKPSNILITKARQAKLLDLGIARSRTHQDTNEKGSTLTADGAMFGTVAFMSPEQASDAGSVDARADIYSLGCTLFYLLTGKPPFESSNPIEVLVAHREQSVQQTLRDSNVPAATHELLQNMLAKDANSRFLTMDEVVSAIDAIDVNSNVQQDHAQYNSRKTSSNFVFRVVLGIAGLIVILLLVNWAIKANRPNNPRVQNLDVSSSSYQNDLARLITGDGGFVVANTEFGQQELVESSEVPQSPINIVQIQLDEVDADFSFGWLNEVKSLRELTIGNSVLSSADANFIGQLKSLRRLEIASCESTPELWSNVSQLDRLETLTTQSPDHLDKLISCIGKLKSLDHLSVTNTDLNDRQAEQILNTTSLLSLDLSGTSVTGKTLHQALEIGKLNDLRLADTNIRDTDFTDLPVDETLQILSLDFCDVGSDAAGFLTKLPALSEVYLEGTQIGNDELKILAECQQLEALDIANTAVTREGVKHLRLLPNLYSLSIASTKIGDRDIPSICELAELQFLNISGTNVTDAGLRKLSALELSMLEVTDCDLSDTAVADFLEQNPDCDVVEIIYETP